MKFPSLNAECRVVATPAQVQEHLIGFLQRDAGAKPLGVQSLDARAVRPDRFTEVERVLGGRFTTDYRLTNIDSGGTKIAMTTSARGFGAVVGLGGFFRRTDVAVEAWGNRLDLYIQDQAAGVEVA